MDNSRKSAPADNPIAYTVGAGIETQARAEEPDEDAPTQTPEEQLKLLRERLKLEDKNARMAARYDLVQKGPAAVPGLIEDLKGNAHGLKDNAHFCRNAAWILGEFKSSAAVPVLLEMMSHPDAYVRVNVVRALGEIGLADPAMKEGIIKPLASVGDFISATVAEALGEMGPDDRATPETLMEVLKDEDDTKRTIAAWALGVNVARSSGQNGSFDRAVIAALVRTFSDNSSNVRLSCDTALRRIGPSAVPSLVTHANGVHPYLSEIRAEIIIKNMGAAALPELLHIVGDTRTSIPDRMKALILLFVCGFDPEAANPALIHLFKDNKASRLADMVKALVPSFEDSDERIVSGAGLSLILILDQVKSPVQEDLLVAIQLAEPIIEKLYRKFLKRYLSGMPAAFPFSVLGALQAIAKFSPTARKLLATILQDGHIKSEKLPKLPERKQKPVQSPEEKIKELFARLPDNPDERREAVVHLLSTVAREGINSLELVELSAEPPSTSGASERPVISLPVAEQTVKTVLVLSHAFHEEMKGSVRQAIATLLQNPPETFLAKQQRADLVNQILDDLRVAIRDPATGSECSVVAVRGRETDEKGYLYLRPRTTAGRTKKRPIPVNEVGEIELTALPPSATLDLPKTRKSS